jgi:reductive dehalogenase
MMIQSYSAHEIDKHNINFPLTVPDYRYDQKNEVFKRAVWDDQIRVWASRLYSEVTFQNRPGYRQLDYALRNAAWNLEYDSGCGNSQGNSGLFSWTRVTDKIRRFIDAGEKLNRSPAELSSIVKKAARFLGADLVGICPVHPNLIYSHEYNLFTKKHYPIDLPENHSSAVVIAIEMKQEEIAHSPNAIGGAATGLGYSRMAFVANLVATYIRGLGYQAAPSGNDTALSIPLAIAAGLGELGRMGMLVTEKFGPRVRICKVFTDMPLTLDTYKPFGVTEFCMTCKKCAKHCPSQSICNGDPTVSGESISNHSGVLKWYINPEKCYKFWVKNWLDCTNCISVCPFNKPPGHIHDATRNVIRNTSAFNRFFVWLDDLLGYGKPFQAKEYWDMS